ncbi:response regulator transcription factor [Pantoea sp. SM3]|uniref:response regulator transcription factor n=1 Tax=Pantoea sp. SM3 TaxID=1628192 RepID=UPI0006970B71|nr:response regulator transcription factor [Pantoea sp. SM3]
MHVIIYDKQPLILDVLVPFFQQRHDKVIVATGDEDDFIYSTLVYRPHLVVFDPAQLSHSSLIKLIRLKRHYADIQIFAYAGDESVYYLLRSLRLEYQAYMSKACPIEKLSSVLTALANNEPVVFRHAKNTYHQLYPDRPIIQSLTNREVQILRHLAAGKKNKTIAQELGLSCKTVSTYKRSIMKKMQTSKISDVVDLAARNGFA